MKRISLLLSVVVILLGCAGALNAAATIYGMSGLIETPDDSIVPARSLTPAVSHISALHVQGGNGFDVNTYGGAIGILPSLEISAVALDAQWGNFKTQALVNAKFRVLAETVDKPSVTVGVVDMGRKINYFSEGLVSETSAFVVFGKNISSVAEDVSGQVSKPLKGTVGYGTGLYNGVFGGLDMSLAPKLSVAVEYLSEGIRARSTVSGCVRFAPIQALSIEAGAIGFKDFYAGASYNVSTF